MSEGDRYDEGYGDATNHWRGEFANALRLAGVSAGEDNEEVLSDAKVREIFATVFGTKATDDEFGPEPTGKGVRKAIGL